MSVTLCKVSVSRWTAREDRRYQRKQAVARKLRFARRLASREQW